MRTVLIEKFVKMYKFITGALSSFAHSHNQIAPPLKGGHFDFSWVE